MDNLYILLSSLVCFIGLTEQFKSLLGSGSTRQQVTVCFTKGFIKPVVEKRWRKKEKQHKAVKRFAQFPRGETSRKIVACPSS